MCSVLCVVNRWPVIVCYDTASLVLFSWGALPNNMITLCDRVPWVIIWSYHPGTEMWIPIDCVSASRSWDVSFFIWSFLLYDYEFFKMFYAVCDRVLGFLWPLSSNKLLAIASVKTNEYSISNLVNFLSHSSVTYVPSYVLWKVSYHAHLYPMSLAM